MPGSIRHPLGLTLSLGALMLVTTGQAGPSRAGAGRTSEESAASRPIAVSARITPVTGRSWLDRKGLTFSESALGRVRGPMLPGKESDPKLLVSSDPMGRSLNLTGADLYRLNCGSCHGANGAGAPPEIKSVIGPIQATSAAFLKERMRSRGISLDPTMARQLAAQSEKAFRDRLQNGGEQMPPLRHLHGAEVESLLAYLQELAGVPHVRQTAVVEPLFRVGEHVVKGTCHTCHAAGGPGPLEVAAMPNALYHPVRPSLDGMVHQLSFDRFEEKVRYGKDPAFPNGRGTMPVFDYLAHEEIEAAFLYLLVYPSAPDNAEAIKAGGK